MHICIIQPHWVKAFHESQPNLYVSSDTEAPGFILGMHPANERRRYIVTSPLIGWAHTSNDPWNPCQPLCMYCPSMSAPTPTSIPGNTGIQWIPEYQLMWVGLGSPAGTHTHEGVLTADRTASIIHTSLLLYVFNSFNDTHNKHLLFTCEGKLWEVLVSSKWDKCSALIPSNIMNTANWVFFPSAFFLPKFSE